LQQIAWHLESSKTLNERARHVWNLIIEHHRDPRNRQWDGDWFDFKRRVGAEGWTASVLRQFRDVATPRLQIRPPFGLAQAKPPSAPWGDIRLRDIGEYEVVLLERHNEELLVPDEALPQVFGILEQQLTVASGLLEDIETVYFQLPTFYRSREAEGREHVTKAAEPVLWFVDLFDRMTSRWPDKAAAHATTWSSNDRFYFRKMKLYALSKGKLFNADQVAEQVLSMNQAAFWDTNVVRELLFLLADRWHEFSEEQHRRLADRILQGPEQPSHLSAEEFRGLRIEFASRYARYLELQGCCLPKEGSQRLEEMIGGIPGWHDARASSMVIERGAYTRWVGTDEKPDAILDLPLSEVIPTARESLERDFGSFTEKRPFTGLVKINPRKALSALSLAARSGDYQEAFWSAMINDLPADITPRLRRAFLNRIRRLPHAAVVKLRHTLGRWLEQSLVSLIDFDDSLGWAVYDHVVEQLMRREVSPGPEERASQEERSLRTYDRAINDAVGMCTGALFRAVPGEEQKRDSLVPTNIKVRLQYLLAAEGEGLDHAASIVGSKLNWLMFVDPAWARERLIPMLEFGHPAAEATWNGFLQSGRAPLPELAASIKPQLLQIFPWISRTSWDRDLQETVAQWLGFMRIFYSHDNGGLSAVEMRSALRSMSDHARNRLIFWLGKVGQKNENGWVEHVIPLINQDWPRERRFRTTASVRAWVGMLDDTGDCFPIVYSAVKRFLMPIETTDHPFYRFTRDDGDEGTLTAQFPELTLDLMDRTTPPVLTRRPYELPKVLALIAEAEPVLTSDPRYLRLIDLVERS